MTDLEANQGALEGGREAYTLVLIDDHADLRLLYRLAFEGTPGTIVGEAGDGASGVEAVREHRPDVALLDLSMPTMDGLEALAGIRQASPTTRVVVLSGFQKARMEPIVFELGAVAYVEKGARPSEIRLAVAKAARRPAPPPPTHVHAVLERARMLV